MKTPNFSSFVAAALICLALVCFAPVAKGQTGRAIYQFDRRTGLSPSGGLVSDSAGALYGVTIYGGKTGQTGATFGTVYKLVPPSIPDGRWKDDVLYAFTGAADGENPYGGVLLEARAGKIFGLGGTSSGDTMVYQLSQGSPWTESVLYAFPGRVYPNPGLIADANGALYGSTAEGGEFTCENGTVGCGMAYKLTPPSQAGGAWTEEVLYNFQGGSDGERPSGGLILDKAGALYGVTFFGGPYDGGTVYKLTPPSNGSGNWTESVLHAFSGGDNAPEGASPAGSLLLDSQGNVYGTTSQYSSYNAGNVYELSPPTTQGEPWTETLLYIFTGGADGGYPEAGLTFDNDGALYGTTSVGGDINSVACNEQDGGVYGCGTVFSVTPPAALGGTWAERVLYAFTNLQGYPYCPALLVGKEVYGTNVGWQADQGALPGVAFQVRF